MCKQHVYVSVSSWSQAVLCCITGKAVFQTSRPAGCFACLHTVDLIAPVTRPSSSAWAGIRPWSSDLAAVLTVSDDLTCFRWTPKFGVTAAEAEILPKVSRLLSAETESMPKVLKSTLSAPKPKPKPVEHKPPLPSPLQKRYSCCCSN